MTATTDTQTSGAGSSSHAAEVAGQSEGKSLLHYLNLGHRIRLQMLMWLWIWIQLLGRTPPLLQLRLIFLLPMRWMFPLATYLLATLGALIPIISNFKRHSVLPLHHALFASQSHPSTLTSLALHNRVSSSQLHPHSLSPSHLLHPRSHINQYPTILSLISSQDSNHCTKSHHLVDIHHLNTYCFLLISLLSVSNL